MQEFNPEGEWKVKYILKPWYRIEEWKGMAPSEAGANLFARNALLQEGYLPSQIQHVETVRIG